ncbi:glycosyltransferase [Erythrobacter litoralis]|uniref:glycosyltransferase family 2 protein n=1 Tax=Erythrobacter litoralis TaxID=39960 RepID=UPI002434B32F|nr:glycosyltransferase [Erythrobacter litoralis]MDG6080289.1 glycosyltransferase [Erythrobacter litoralis]
MKELMFSVVIAAYNADATIGAAIDSVLSQTEENFELIIIDDGSTDRTLATCLAKASDDFRIKVAAQPNAGVSAARNNGVMKARGTYLAFLDADDIWHAEKLQAHRDLHAANPELKASFARVAFCTEVDGKLKAGRTKSAVPDRFCTLEDVLIENAVCTMSNLVMRRDTFLELGGFDESMRHVEDQDLLARFVGAGHLVRGIPQTFVGYRLSEDGLSCDFKSMYAAWRELAGRWEESIDLRKGEALYCRYLARRSLRSGGAPTVARNFVRQGLSSDHRAFLSGGSRGLLTAGAAVVASAVPKPARAALFA